MIMRLLPEPKAHFSPESSIVFNGLDVLKAEPKQLRELRGNKVVVWYMELPNPTMEQSGLVSIVVGAGAAWFGLYTGSSKKIDK